MAERVVSLTSWSADLRVILLRIPNVHRPKVTLLEARNLVTLSAFKSFVHKEKTIMKRILLVLGAAVLFLQTLTVPALTSKEGGGGTGTNCGGSSMCKP